MALFDANSSCPTDVLRLRDLLPSHYFDDDGTTAKFVDIFEGVYCQLINDIDALPKIYDPDVTDERFLDLLFLHLGFDLKIHLSVNRKRKLLKVIVNAYKQKGTAPGIENVIRQFIGVDVIVFPFTSGWVISLSELGIDTYLNPAPSNPAGFYTFDIIVATKLSVEQRRVIFELVKLMKPAHSHFRSLIEEATDPFLLTVLVMLNRGSLYLRNTQNTDGGWDAADSDGNTATPSLRANVSSHTLGQYYSAIYTELPSVDVSAIAGVNYLITNVVYSFTGFLPEPNDIETLNIGDGAYSIVGADLLRDSAITALQEFIKAIAFLNNPTPSVPALAATTQPERDSTAEDKRASFLYLNLVTVYGLGNGIIRYADYIRDFLAISDDGFAKIMVAQLYIRLSTVDLSTNLGQSTIGACGAIIKSLQIDNVGLVYENKIAEAISVLETRYVPGEKLHYDLSLGSGRIYEQAYVVDAWMSRQKFDEAKALIDGIRLKQRVDGSFNDPIEPGTSRLKANAKVMDAAGRAIKRIDDDGL